MTTHDEETRSLVAIDFCRRHFRTLGEVEFAKRGAGTEDIAIGAIYSAVDLGQHLTGDTASAIAWARLMLDDMERQLMEGVTVQ